MADTRGKWAFGDDGGFSLLAPSVAAFLTAAALRLIPIFGDPWLDEIWSWYLARLASTPVEIFTKLAHDNNHPLNTLYIWALGDQPAWPWYRLLSLVTGIASVGLMGVIARRYGKAESLAALVLGGFSYFLICYSSEARGYAPAVFFALVSFLLAGDIGNGNGRLHRCLLWLAVLLGLLSHSTYAFVYAGIFAWTALRLVKRGDRPGQVVAQMGVTHGIPLLILAADILWLKGVTVGGGPVYTVPGVVSDAVLFAFGLPRYRPLAVIACTAAVVLFFLELWSLRREVSGQWVFYLAAILIAPALTLVASRPAVLFPRYFLVCVPFFLLLAARWLGWLSRKGIPGKVICALLLIAYCSCNLFLYRDLVRYGRGGYSAAMESIASQTVGGILSIGSDHDFRNGMLVDFFSRRLPAGKKAVYIPGTGIRPEAAPEWFVAHRIAADPPSIPAPGFLLPNGTGYVLDGVFPSSALSGFWWFLYRKAG